MKRHSLRRRYGHARKGKTALAAEAYLEKVYSLLPSGPYAWAKRPDIYAQWMPFAMSHARAARKGFLFTGAKDLANAIEISWRDHGSP